MHFAKSARQTLLENNPANHQDGAFFTIILDFSSSLTRRQPWKDLPRESYLAKGCALRVVIERTIAAGPAPTGKLLLDEGTRH